MTSGMLMVRVLRTRAMLLTLTISLVTVLVMGFVKFICEVYISSSSRKMRRLRSGC